MTDRIAPIGHQTHSAAYGRPRGYSRIVYALYCLGLLHKVAFRKPSPNCDPPALTAFGRLLRRLDYHLDYDGLRGAK